MLFKRSFIVIDFEEKKKIWICWAFQQIKLVATRLMD